MKKCFDLEFLSRYRSALMGLAISWIFFYHTGVSVPGLHSIVASGWMGVDIFFLVSGFGCCASLTKNPDVPAFYKRRAVRILPTWLAILLYNAPHRSADRCTLPAYVLGRDPVVHRIGLVAGRAVL